MNVALFIFNRPAFTKLVFERIAAAKPDNLFVICDGPRSGHPEDIANIGACHRIVEQVDWPCTVDHNYAKQNMGCGRRVASGLDWVFSKVEDAIILEDDCIPASSFFVFCQTLLNEYRNDSRVMHIAGTNLLPRPHYAADVIVSRLVPIWGWATWRRAWSAFDFKMTELQPCLNNADMLYYGEHASFVQGVFQYVAGGRIDIWDAQWAFACFKNQGLSLIPRLNLVSNMGFGAGATHTTETPVFRVPKVCEMSDQLKLPSALTADFVFDRKYLTVQRGEPRGFFKLLRRIRWKVQAITAILKKIWAEF